MYATSIFTKKPSSRRSQTEIAINQDILELKCVSIFPHSIQFFTNTHDTLSIGLPEKKQVKHGGVEIFKMNNLQDVLIIIVR